MTVCIPTCDRPPLLQSALESCFAQQVRPLRIIVGDNSHSDATRLAVASMRPPSGVEVRYLWPQGAASQRDNVCRLLQLVETEYASLLHDDDRFCPGGLDALLAGASQRPEVIGVFGLQEVIDLDGTILQRETELKNRQNYRGSEQLGRTRSMWFSALTGQFPSNGFLVKAELARSAAAAMPARVGTGADLAFAMMLAAVSRDGSVFVLPNATHQYRITPGGESDRMDHLPMVEVFRQANVPAPYETLRKERADRFLMAAIAESISRGDLNTYRRLVLSQEYPIRERFRPRGVYHLAAALLPLPARLLAIPHTLRKRPIVDPKGGVRTGH